MFKVTAQTILVLGLGLQAGALAADEIYRWVDDDGVVHFSDKPPASQGASVETVDVEIRQPAGGQSGEDIYNIEATAERMQAIRKSYEDERQARRERQRAASQAVVQYPPQPVQYGVPFGYPVYPSRPPKPWPPEPEIPPIPEPYPGDSVLAPPGSWSD